MLCNKETVDTLTHVVMSPIDAVEVHNNGVPRLMNNGGRRVADFVKAINQMPLEAINQACPCIVIATHAKHEALILGILAIFKERGFKVFVAISGFGAQFERFLGHIKAVLSLQAKFHALTQELLAVNVVFDMPFARFAVIFDVAIDRVLEGNVVLDNVVTHGEHAVFFIPQSIGIGDKAHDGEGVEQVWQIRLGDGVTRRQTPVLIKGSSAKHRDTRHGENGAWLIIDARF